MKKMLRASDKILLSLAFLGDLTLEVWTRGHGFGRKKDFLEALDIKNSTFRAEVARFLKIGDIEKFIDNKGVPSFKLSSRGLDRIERIYPLSKLYRKPWDGKWRVVIFDIEENKRDIRNSLRHKLISLGFGKLQKSVYITPLDVLVDLKEWLRNEQLYGEVMVFEAREVFGQDPKVIAAYVWKLKSLDNQYEKLRKKARWLLDSNITDVTKEEKAKLREELFQLLLKDPFLPKEFLPKDWSGEEAKKLTLSL